MDCSIKALCACPTQQSYGETHFSMNRFYIRNDITSLVPSRDKITFKNYDSMIDIQRT